MNSKLTARFLICAALPIVVANAHAQNHDIKKSDQMVELDNIVQAMLTCKKEKAEITCQAANRQATVLLSRINKKPAAQRTLQDSLIIGTLSGLLSKQP